MKATLKWTVLFLLATYSGLRAAPIQWTVASGGNGHYYSLTPIREDWISAEAYGVSQGGHLASINSAAEQAFINATFLVLDDPNVPLWIGLQNSTPLLVTPHYDMWTSGEPITYTNWNLIAATGVQEPNNENGNEDYVTINWHNSFGYPNPRGTWNDLPLNGFSGYPDHPQAQGPYYGLIEVVPEPATNVIVGLVSLGGLLWLRTRRSSSLL